MKKDIRILLCICAAMGWWGFLYPELAMTPDTYRIVEDGTQSGEEAPEHTDLTEWASGSDIYWKVLGADCSQVRFRSRLFDSLAALTEHRREDHGSGE